MAIKSSALVKRAQLQRAKDKLTEIRSSAYLWNNIPPETLKHVEAACEQMQRALQTYDDVMRPFDRGGRK